MAAKETRGFNSIIGYFRPPAGVAFVGHGAIPIPFCLIFIRIFDLPHLPHSGLMPARAEAHVDDRESEGMPGRIHLLLKLRGDLHRVSTSRTAVVAPWRSPDRRPLRQAESL